MSKMDSVVPTKFSLNKEFKFRCHKDIKCFTRCCSDIDIVLTPYDVLRMKNRLKLSTGEFLSKYTYLKIDEKSFYPFAMLKMLDEEDKKCPFVNSEGCRIYTDRPANCRYYPIGQGTLKKEGKKGPEEEEFYFFVKEPHCFGYQENKAWTIASWRSNQEADVYDDMNKEWKSMQLKKDMPGQVKLDDDKQAQLYMATYDFDSFRSFILNSGFLDIFDIDDETLNKIKTDEIYLMQFGFKYVKYILMIEKTLNVKDGALKARQKKPDENSSS